MFRLLRFSLVAALFTFGLILAHAQREGYAGGCSNAYPGSNGITITNNCNFTIHYYIIPYNDPYKHYNNYLQPGESTNMGYDLVRGQFEYYACDSRYYVVGPDGRVITHLVNSYSCSLK